MTEPRRGIVVFDNTGTISEAIVETTATNADCIDEPVPDIDPTHPCALVSIACIDYSVFAVDDAVGLVLAREQLPGHIALANVETTESTVRAALEADTETPARLLFDQVEAVTDRVSHDYSEWVDSPVSVQVVVDIKGERIFGDTTISLPESDGLVDALDAAGFDVHLASGDATHVLARVADTLGIIHEHVHPYQSPTDKAATIRALQADTDRPVIMVGDYVNDRFAFKTADYAVYARDPGTPQQSLLDNADAVIEDLSTVVATVDALVPS